MNLLDKQEEEDNNEFKSISPTPYIPPPPDTFFDIEAERAVLGGMLEDKSIIPGIIELLGINDKIFHLGPNQILYRSILELYEATGFADPLSVASYMSDQGRLERFGGSAELAEIAMNSPAAINASHYAEIVLDKWKRRRLKEMGLAVCNLSKDTNQSLPEVMDKVNDMLFDTAIDKRRDGFNLENILNNLIDDATGEIPREHGIMSGFKEFDELFGRLYGKQVLVIAGRPSAGKSTVCHHIVIHNLDKGIPCILYSLDDSEEVFVNRTLCTLAEISYLKVKNRLLNNEEKERYVKAAQWLSGKPLRVYTKCLNLIEMKASIRANQVEFDTENVLVIIDFLQLMINTGNPYNDTSQASRGVKRIAQDLNVPLIAVSQLTRGSELRETKRPAIFDLRNSGAIEEDATGICFVHRPGQKKDDIADDEIQLILAKSKHTSLGEISYKWIGQYMKIGNQLLIQ